MNGRSSRLVVGVLRLALWLVAPASSQPEIFEHPKLAEEIRVPDREDLDARAGARADAAWADLRAALDRDDAEGTVESLRTLGRVWAAAYRREAALAAFRNLIALRPDDFPALYYSATLEAQLGQDAVASQLLERALALRPADLAAGIRLGRLQLRGDDVDAAESTFRRVLAEHEAEPAALFGLAEVKRLAGDCSAAIEIYEDVLRRQPEAASVRYPLAQCLRRTGETQRARSELKRHADVPVTFEDPLTDELVVTEPTTVQLLTLATAMAASGQLDDAVIAYREVLSFDPNDANALNGLARALLSRGDLEEGQRTLERLAAGSPDNAIAHHDLAQVYRQRGLAERAIESVRSALRAAPEFARAYLTLAELQLEKGESAEAALSLERAYATTRAIESDRQTRGWSGLLLANLRMAEAPGEALPLLDESADLLRDDLEAQQLAGQLYMRSARYGDGARRLRLAAELAPQNAGLYFGSGLAFMLAEEDDAAAQILGAGLERHANDPAIRQLLARLLSCSRDASVRDPARALPLAERAFRAGPSIDGAETLAMALVSSGDRATGLDWQRQALQRARSVGDRQRAQAAALRLQTYESGEQCDAPWLDSDPN
ncbi:MAG: tetratricopeptide repeat protein [Acidobacteriota bacterium]